MNFVFFLRFTEGEQQIFHQFSDIRKHWYDVEFFSLSPFRKTNDEQGFLFREVNSKENKPKGQVIESQFSTVSPLESVDDVWSSFLFPWQPYDSHKNCSPPFP